MSTNDITTLRVKIGNGVKPVLPTFEESFLYVQARKEVFSKINYFLSNQERYFSDYTGMRHVAYQANLAKAAELVSHIPLEHVHSGNVLDSSIIGSWHFIPTDGLVNRLFRSVSEEQVKQQLGAMSAFAAMPNWLKKIISELNESDFGDGTQHLTRKFIKKAFAANKIEWKTDYSWDCNESAKSAYDAFQMNHTSTQHPFIFKNNESGEYVWIQDAAALHLIGYKTVWDIQRSLVRLRKYRKALKDNRKTIDSKVKGLTVDKVLWQLSDVRPTSWNDTRHISSMFGKYAEKRFPKGSLVGIEIEFVANHRSPLNDNTQSCGDCEACQNGDDHECSDPVSSAEWLNMPFVWFKHDGSISATSDGQVVLPYQEMNVVANINDSTDFARVKKVLDWMNANKMEVNKTCGLHVHLDSRHCTPNMFTRKSNKMEEAMKNWIQFCVPFSRASNSYCKVFGSNRGDRYKAVNRTSFHKYQTLEIRIGSASLNYTKVKNWAKLLSYCFNTRENIERIDDFLKSDASPEIKAFAISRICRFYHSHTEGRSADNHNNNLDWVIPGTERNHIPQDITDIFNTWKEVIQQEGNNA